MRPAFIACAVVMILLWAAWRNTSVRPNHRHDAGADDVRQDLARTHGGELVDVADDQEGSVVRDGLQEGLHQDHVDHRALVDHQAGRSRAGSRYHA